VDYSVWNILVSSKCRTSSCSPYSSTWPQWK